MEWADIHKTFEVPYLSGCFMFMRGSAFKKVGGFDSRFFPYCEDIDLSRRVNREFKTVYYSEVFIYHYFNRASYKSLKYFYHHFVSAFNKHGWLVDIERLQINSKTKETYRNAVERY